MANAPCDWGLVPIFWQYIPFHVYNIRHHLKAHPDYCGTPLMTTDLSYHSKDIFEWKTSPSTSLVICKVEIVGVVVSVDPKTDTKIIIEGMY